MKRHVPLVDDQPVFKIGYESVASHDFMSGTVVGVKVHTLLDRFGSPFVVPSHPLHRHSLTSDVDVEAAFVLTE